MAEDETRGALQHRVEVTAELLSGGSHRKQVFEKAFFSFLFFLGWRRRRREEEEKRAS